MTASEFESIKEGAAIRLQCGGRGPSNGGDPYGIHVALSWEWLGRFARIEDDAVVLSDPVSPHVSLTDKETGEEIVPRRMGTPLDLVGAVQVGNVTEMSPAEFERQYAERSGVAVERLRELGRVVRPCGCDSDDCEGWQSITEENWRDEEWRWSVERLETEMYE